MYMYNIIKFLGIIFDEKVYGVTVFIIVLLYLTFHDFHDSFADNAMQFCKKLITYFHISDLS